MAVTFDALLAELENKQETTWQVIPSFKEALADARASLIERFNLGEETDNLIAEYTAFMDGVMRFAWNRFNWAENRNSWRKSRLSLVAVGGYGRRELLPNSDIDLLILLERNSHDVHRANIQSFIALLWDIGLDVGHSVRSARECGEQGAGDITVLTAMMESRTIIGDDNLLEKMHRRIRPGKTRSARFFYLAKRAEQDARHDKFAHTEYSLEPNVKTSPGGLRDIQTLAWVARRQYGTSTFTELAEREILTPEESNWLISDRNYLWKIRFALHSITGKDENRLLFQHQQQLAGMFGYQDGDQLAVEQFMQQYYRVALRVNTINETLLQHFEEVIVQANSRLTIKPINDSFRLVNNLLEVTSDQVFKESPSALLEMFVLAGSDEKINGFRATSIRLAQQHVDLIDEDFRADSRNAALFMALLGCKNHLFTQLKRMARWGILGAYLPEFGRVIGQMQFDLFHIYTVDAHTLQVVRNMRRFRYKNQAQPFPIAAHVHPRLPRIELLYIAGLYHDIAKGMGGDHSELAVDIVKNFCARHRLSTWDTNLACWLVQNHLAMSFTAQRKDIQDPEVIHDFAGFVGDQVRLDYLYALTVADINATNPTLWNGWRASLLNQLYSETKKALRQGLEHHVDRHEYIQDIRQQAIARLEEHRVNRSRVLELWDRMDDDYFVRERISDIVTQTQAILAGDINQGPIILIYDDVARRTDSGFSQIFVHTRNRKDLFAAIVTAIDRLGLTIVEAGIATSAANLTFNTFTVLESNGQPVGNKSARIEKIRNTIIHHLQEDNSVLARNRRTSRALRQFVQKTRVNLRQYPHLPHSALEVISPDRPGLLAVIAGVFADLGVNLISAKITTLGERVEDVFYISDMDGNPMTDPDKIDTLCASICEALDQHVERIAS